MRLEMINREQDTTGSGTPPASASQHDCHSEESFLDMLAFERKRSERSGRPFLVMTLDFTAMQNPQKRREAIRGTLEALSALTRVTDVKGWFRYGSVLGVIFTEVNSFETDTLQKKIHRELLEKLPSERVGMIRIEFHRFPDDGRSMKTMDASQFTFYPDLPQKSRERKGAFRAKRVVDIVGSLAGLVLFSPFFLLIPVCIKLTSRGPVLFRQERVGQYEKKFPFLKFRSMYVNQSQDRHKEFVYDLITGKNAGAGDGTGKGKKVYKITKDDRITSVGMFLRKTSLDELPQFVNVLKGEMSLVGPRPPIPYELEKYDSWHRRRVREVKPGITGLWQVSGRSSTTFDEMVRLDLQYARNWTLWMDIKILWKTPWAMVSGKGAY